MSTPHSDDKAGYSGHCSCINRRYCSKRVDSGVARCGEKPAMTNIGQKIWGGGSNQLQEPQRGVTPVQNLLPRASDTSCPYMDRLLISMVPKDIRVQLGFG